MKIWRVTGEGQGLVATLYVGAIEQARIKRLLGVYLVDIGSIQLSNRHTNLRIAMLVAEKLVMFQLEFLAKLAQKPRRISKTLWNSGEISDEISDGISDEISDENQDDILDSCLEMATEMRTQERRILEEIRIELRAAREKELVLT